MTDKSPKIAKKFECRKCDYSCSKESDLNKHLITLKHKKNDTELPENRLPEYKCKCGKIYSFRQGLSVHKKKCKQDLEEHLKNCKYGCSQKIDEEKIKNILD